jgi:hypothetical protein
MSINLHSVTAIPAVTFGLFCVLIATACDAPEDPDPNGVWVATDDEDGLEDPLDTADPPALPEAPPPNGFAIEKVTINGKGCPNADSVTVQTSANNSLVRVSYDEMVLEQSSEQVIQTTSCTMTLKLQIPAGWKVAPKIVRARGYAYLDEAIKARRNTNMFFAGVPVGVKFNTNLQGPHKGPFHANDVVSPATTAWSSCGGSALFSITNSLVLNGAANPDGEGFFDFQQQRLVAWQFKPC